MILTSSSKKQANQHIRTINYKLSLDIKESGERFISYDYGTRVVKTLSSSQSITQIVRFTDSVDVFLKSIKSDVDSNSGVIMTSKMLSDLKDSHIQDKL